jgi:hypothetical protein
VITGATIREWLRTVAQHWFAAVVAFVAAIIGVIQGVFVDLHVSLWIWLGIFAIGFVYAQLAAFSDVVEERDVAVANQDRLDPATQRIGFKNTLIAAAAQARELEENVFVSKPQRKRWLDVVAAFLAAAVGDGEAAALREASTYRGYAVTLAGGDDARDDVWLDETARRLDQLRERADTIPIRPDFNPDGWRERLGLPD